jgi:hypothetical protein
MTSPSLGRFFAQPFRVKLSRGIDPAVLALLHQLIVSRPDWHLIKLWQGGSVAVVRLNPISGQ